MDGHAFETSGGHADASGYFRITVVVVLVIARRISIVSGKHLLHDVSLDVGQPEVTAGVTVSETLMLQTQGME